MRTAALTIVLALCGLSVPSPAQVGVRFDAPGVHIRLGDVPHRRPVVRQERVWVEGYWRRVWVEAEYGYRRDACGRAVRVVVRPACWHRVWVPGYWTVRACDVRTPRLRRHR